MESALGAERFVNDTMPTSIVATSFHYHRYPPTFPETPPRYLAPYTVTRASRDNSPAGRKVHGVG